MPNIAIDSAIQHDPRNQQKIKIGSKSPRERISCEHAGKHLLEKLALIRQHESPIVEQKPPPQARSMNSGNIVARIPVAIKMICFLYTRRVANFVDIPTKKSTKMLPNSATPRA
jgi:hypothetical protein